MTTKIGKVLAIFTALAGVAFLGFASVSSVGGPNWEAKMHAEDLRDYSFEASDDKEPTWSVKRLLGGAAVGGSTKIAPQAIVAARSDLKTNQMKEHEELEKDLQNWQQQLADAEKFIKQDQAGIDLRLKELDTELAELNKKIEDVSNAVQTKSREVQATQAEATRRQEDVRLYEIQLNELRTDRYRALEQQKILRDQLVRIRGTNDQLQRRNDDLKKATGSP